MMKNISKFLTESITDIDAEKAAKILVTPEIENAICKALGVNHIEYKRAFDVHPTAGSYIYVNGRKYKERLHISYIVPLPWDINANSSTLPNWEPAKNLPDPIGYSYGNYVYTGDQLGITGIGKYFKIEIGGEAKMYREPNKTHLDIGISYAIPAIKKELQKYL